MVIQREASLGKVSLELGYKGEDKGKAGGHGSGRSEQVRGSEGGWNRPDVVPS